MKFYDLWVFNANPYGLNMVRILQTGNGHLIWIGLYMIVYRVVFLQKMLFFAFCLSLEKTLQNVSTVSSAGWFI